MAKGFFGRLFGRKDQEREENSVQEQGDEIVVQKMEPEEDGNAVEEPSEKSGILDIKSVQEETKEDLEEKLIRDQGVEKEQDSIEDSDTAYLKERTIQGNPMEKDAGRESRNVSAKEGDKVQEEVLPEMPEKTDVQEEVLLERPEKADIYGKASLESSGRVDIIQNIESEESAGIWEEEPQMAPKKQGFFKRLVSGLTKTRNHILSGINDVFHGFSSIDDDFYEELEEILVMADIGINTTTKILEDLKQKVKEQKIREPEACRQLLIDSIKAQMAIGENAYEFEHQKSVVLLIGVNGVGKTTSVGKLAGQLKAQKKKVLMAAADTFRAAAIEQLTEWANRAGVEIIAQKEGSDPAAVVFDAVTAAKARNTDVLLCDTAGRLHNKKNLMEELKKIDRVITREYPDAYRETLVVLDGTTGQNALVQAREFSEVADITGIILTKMDGTAKGGIAIAIQSELGIPVKYIGIGEKIDDLQKFNADDFVNALFTEEHEI